MFHSLVPRLGLHVPTRDRHRLGPMTSATPLPSERSFAGIAPDSIRPLRLLRLSTFLGHVDPASTAVYLTITQDLLQEANRRFEEYARPAFEEPSP